MKVEVKTLRFSVVDAHITSVISFLGVNLVVFPVCFYSFTDVVSGYTTALELDIHLNQNFL